MKRTLGVWLLVLYAAFIALSHLAILITLIPGVLPENLQSSVQAVPSGIALIVIDMLLFGYATVATWRLKRIAATLFVIGLAWHVAVFAFHAFAMPDFFAAALRALFLPQALGTAIGLTAIIGSRRLVKRGVLA